MFSKNAIKILNREIKPIYDLEKFGIIYRIMKKDISINKSLFKISSKSFAKKSTKKEKSSTIKQDDWLEFDENHDKTFEDYLKDEEKLQKEKESEKKRQIEKREEGLKCLVLHPVFAEK
jgi:hypothetical protein